MFTTKRPYKTPTVELLWGGVEVIMTSNGVNDGSNYGTSANDWFGGEL